MELNKSYIHELCGKNKWPKLTYKVLEEFGRAHDNRFVCSIEVEVVDPIHIVSKKEKSQVREVENAVAYLMIHALKNSKYI